MTLNMKGYLALLTTFGFLAILVGLSLGVLKVNDSPAILILYGTLGAGWSAVIGYYFGSAEASTLRAAQRKTDETETKGEVKP